MRGWQRYLRWCRLTRNSGHQADTPISTVAAFLVRPLGNGAAGLLLVAGLAGTASAGVHRGHTFDLRLPADHHPLPTAQESDTIPVPLADSVPVPDCEISEWPAIARIHLRPGAVGAYSRGVVEGREDLSTRVELVWTEDALHLLVDARDDWVLGGAEEGGDWLQLRLGGTSVWVGAPGSTGSVVLVGTRATGESVRNAAGCRTDYGWTAEATLPAAVLRESPSPGAVIPFRALYEDDDAGGGGRASVLWREGHLLLTTAPSPGPAPTSEELLERMRAPATLQELGRRPGARDTTVVLGGRRYPAVRLPVADMPVTAFAATRDTSAVTYWLGSDSEEALEVLGFQRSLAALRRELGALQRPAEGDVTYAWPRVRFELLPGVVFQLGDPTGQLDEIPASAVPRGVFIETRRPGESGG